jgi:hypothetical protein
MKHLKPLPALDELHRLFLYEPKTGLLIRRVASTKSAAGTAAGTPNPKGRLIVRACGGYYCVHRICWALYYGEDPCALIDHKNRNPSDNRIANLRLASNSQNKFNVGPNKNSTSGLKGTRFDKRAKSRPWAARIMVDGRDRYLGMFATAEEAHAAYCAAAAELHGEFVCTA